MTKIPYSKGFLEINAQLQQLKDRGLTVENDAKALHLLETISYYRLSGYWYPLLADKPNHLFKVGASFETAFKLYCFDRKLRKMVTAELEKIEIAIRAKMTYILSQTNGAFWFGEQNLFIDLEKYSKSLSSIEDEYSRSDEEFIKAFKVKYSNPLPPSWMIVEVTSFGTLSKLYSNLKHGKEKRDIANHFGLPDNVFKTWLHSIVYLRNVCAHHSRLWNRTMSITPKKLNNPHKQWLNNTNISNNKTYFILCMINYLLQIINPNNTFRNRLKNLLSEYPNVDVKAMGFPQDWESEPLWHI